MVLMRGLTDGSAPAEGDVGEEGRVGFRGFVGRGGPQSRGVSVIRRASSLLVNHGYKYFLTAPRSAVALSGQSSVPALSGPPNLAVE